MQESTQAGRVAVLTLRQFAFRSSPVPIVKTSPLPRHRMVGQRSGGLQPADSVLTPVRDIEKAEINILELIPLP